MNQEDEIDMVQDEVGSFTVTVLNGVTPVNITGFSFTFRAKAQLSDDTPVFALAVGSGIALTTPATGILTVTITPTNLANAVFSSNDQTTYLSYELLMTDTGGSTTALLYGPLGIRRAI